MPFAAIPQSLSLSLSLSNMAKSQNCKFNCLSGILCCLLYIGSHLTQPSVPTTDIPTSTTTTFKNPKKNYKTQVNTPGVVTRLMGLDSLPDHRKVFRRKEDQKEKTKCMFLIVHIDGRPPNVIARLMGLDGLPSQQPLHRQLKGFSKTYRQWTASVSLQKDGKPYELRSNRKDSMAQQECKDEYEVLETSKVERSSYPAERAINSKLSEAEMAFIQPKFMADHGTFGQVLECLDNENLEHLAMMERLLGPLPQHMIITFVFRNISRGVHTWIGWRVQAPKKVRGQFGNYPAYSSQNYKFKCFSDILCCLLYIGSLLTQPSVPTTDIPTTTTTTTTFENPKKNFKTEVKTPGVVARLMGLDSLPDPRKVFRRKEDQKEKNNIKEYRILSKMDEGTFGQVLECLDTKNLEHLAMMERLLGPLPQHMIISADIRAEKYFKRSAPLDWLEGACSKESTRAV
ncbi:unnamed protein product [Camellia sinensis]